MNEETEALEAHLDDLRAAALRVINEDGGRHEQSIGQVLCRECRRKWPCAMSQLREAVGDV
jgi:hypothetical protein